MCQMRETIFGHSALREERLGVLRNAFSSTFWERLLQVQQRHHWRCFSSFAQSLVRQVFRLLVMRQENGSKDEILRTGYETSVQALLRQISARTEKAFEQLLQVVSQKASGRSKRVRKGGLFEAFLI